MKLKLSLILLLFGQLFYGQTQVSGNQSGTWTLANSPYEVTGTITIPAGQTLSIEAGVWVNFQGYYQIIVEGKLLTNGTNTQPVNFVPIDTSTGWGGVRIDTNNEISVFHYTGFYYGKTSATAAYPNNHGGAVLLKDANAEFYNCFFSNNEAIGDDDGMGGAVYCINTGTATQTLTKFINCTFEYNYAYGEGGAMKFTNDGNTEISGCKFIYNTAGYGGGAIMFYSAVDVHLTNCLFAQNSSDNSGGGAIKAMNPTVSLFFTNCTFYNNIADGAGEGGAVALDYADATFTNSIIYNNQQTYGDEINIGMNASATINYCDVNMPPSANGSNNLANLDPLFVDTGHEDFHLQTNSPCIDAGIDVGLPYNGAAPDLGCFETGTASVNFINNSQINIYPVPTSNMLNINNKTGNNYKMTIYNADGKMIWPETNLQKQIPLDNLFPGVYTLYIYNNQQKIIKKIIKK